MRQLTGTACSVLLSCVIAHDARSQGFVDVTQAAGLNGFPLDTAIYADGTHGTGMCAADFDRDGDVDLVIPESVGGSIRYFRNDGGMVFSDQTASSGFGTSRGPRSVRAADVDNDGDLDVYLSNWNELPQLYINSGNAQFVDEAPARGLTHDTSSWGAAFGDFDNDGWLDLYIGNRFVDGFPGVTESNILYRNTGGGNFVNVTNGSGVSHSQGATLFGTFFDYDEDGWLDIYICNDKGHSYAPNELYRNNRNGTFTPIGAIVGAVDAIDAMGFDSIDVFQDGGMDYYVSDVSPDHLFRVWDPVLRRYTNETYTFGLAGGYVGWAVHFLDYDNDCWPDLHVVHMNGPNHLYLNPRRPRAALVPWPRLSYPSSPTTRQVTAVTADFDNDGRIDILNRMITLPGGPTEGLLLHRNIAPQRHWIKIRTVGSKTNRDGFGALIELRSGGITQRQHMRAGVGYFSTNDHRCHFGLDAATTVDEIKVKWPTGQVQSLRNVAADQTLTITEPRMWMAGTPAVGSSCTLELDCPNDDGMNYAIFLAMQETPATPLPDGRFLPVSFDELTAATLAPGNPVLHGNVAALQNGRGVALFTVPNIPSIRGMRVYASGLTYDPTRLPLGTIFPKSIAVDIQ